MKGNLIKQTLHFYAVAVAASGLLAAQGGLDTQNLLKGVQNPVASLMSVPFQNNTNFPIGSHSRGQDVLNIQLVIPLEPGEDWNLFLDSQLAAYCNVIHPQDLPSG